jgi:uncharacterized protein (TIGR00725 family)
MGMSPTLRLDRTSGILHDAAGRRFDVAGRSWASAPPPSPSAEAIDALAALRWLQRESGRPLRAPVGVIGPRDATPRQLAAAREVGEGLARGGLAIVCGGRHGVMEAVCEGAARASGLTIGLLPDADPSLANPFVTVALATGIGEARNALVARSSFCLVAIGDSFGTLSEVALGRQFGKLVIGLEGAARVEGVRHLPGAAQAVELVALHVLGLDTGTPLPGG